MFHLKTTEYGSNSSFIKRDKLRAGSCPAVYLII